MAGLADNINWVDKFLLVALLFILYKLWNHRRRPLPPGPPPLPVIGNVHQIPSAHNHLTFTEWGKLYGLSPPASFIHLKAFSRILGPIIHLSILGQSLIVLTTPQAALDLLEKRGVNYANRPRLVMAGEL